MELDTFAANPTTESTYTPPILESRKDPNEAPSNSRRSTFDTLPIATMDLWRSRVLSRPKRHTHVAARYAISTRA
jgi:hypothetical protein